MKPVYFRINASSIDPPSLQSRFVSLLKKFEVPQSDLAAENLFAGIREHPELVCPFPLVTTPAAADTQAKKLRGELKSAGVSLGRCRKIFAEFWGYHAWQPFIKDVENFCWSHHLAPGAECPSSKTSAVHSRPFSPEGHALLRHYSWKCPYCHEFLVGGSGAYELQVKGMECPFCKKFYKLDPKDANCNDNTRQKLEAEIFVKNPDGSFDLDATLANMEIKQAEMNKWMDDRKSKTFFDQLPGDLTQKAHFGFNAYKSPSKEISKEKGLEILQEGARRKNGSALFFLGLIYLNTKMDDLNPAEGVRCLIEASCQGLYEASFLLAQAYLMGEAIPKNLTKAFIHMQFAAQKNIKDAAKWLGYMYCRAAGVDQDLDAAMKWLRIAVEQNPQDMATVGWLGEILVRHGKNKEDINQGLELLEKASLTNYNLMCILGANLMTGVYGRAPERTDSNKGFRYLSIAAENGVEDAKEIVAAALALSAVRKTEDD